MEQIVPCIRHGVAGIDDRQLRDVIGLARQRAGDGLEEGLSSLNEIEGQLWVTWRDEGVRHSLSGPVTEAWRELGAQGRVLHLVPVDDEYDYQEDAMNATAE